MSFLLVLQTDCFAPLKVGNQTEWALGRNFAWEGNTRELSQVVETFGMFRVVHQAV